MVKSLVKVSRTDVEAFLTKGVEVMMSEDTRDVLSEVSTGRPGVKLIELQLNVWDELGVDKQLGRTAIDSIERFYENSEELVAMRSHFVETSKATYLQALEDRRPAELETKANLPRETVLEFFDATIFKMESKATMEQLEKFVLEKGTSPMEILNEQRAYVMEMLGFEKKHGLNKFGNLADDFPEDREMKFKYEEWLQKSVNLCLSILLAFKLKGGELTGGEKLDADVRQFQVHVELQRMSPEERGALLTQNAKMVQDFRAMLPADREQHVKGLSEAEKVELSKSEALLVSQMQAQRAAQAQAPATQDC